MQEVQTIRTGHVDYNNVEIGEGHVVVAYWKGELLDGMVVGATTTKVKVKFEISEKTANIKPSLICVIK